MSVADIRALDSDHLQDGFKDWGADVCLCGETDDDDGSAGSDVFGGLLEWLLVDRNEDDGVGAESVFGGGLDILDNVARLGKVDE